ncbi:MAG: diadenylate cyclase CdaA [Thermaurantimonas sp.]
MGGLTWISILDILIVSLLIYQIYRLIRGTSSQSILVGILIIYAVWKVVQWLHLTLLTEILSRFIDIGFLALVIIFQTEIRRFLLVIGTPGSKLNFNWLRKILIKKKDESSELRDYDQILLACERLQRQGNGALIVIGRKNALSLYIQTGISLEAHLSALLLECIFQKTSPLHDGAVIIEKNKITSARVILPVSENPRLPAHFGLRHRAAVGISERTDAIVIAISEESGQVMVCHDGQYRVNVGKEELSKELHSYFLF